MIIYTAGGFDLFHVGHLNILRKSKKLGDYLIVAVSTDKLIKSYKENYPTIPFKERVKIIKAIKYVDKVIKQKKLINIKQLKKYKVDILTIGTDWKNKHLEGLDWMKKNKKVIFLPYTKKLSTTLLKKRIIKDAYKIIKAQIRRENKK